MKEGFLVLVCLFFLKTTEKHIFSSPLKYNDSYLVTVKWVMQIHVYRSEQEGKVEDWKNPKLDYVLLI